MTPNASRAWRPQSPPSDFVDRTVEAILLDRTERRRTARPRRFLCTVAIAVTLIAAGAWALSIPRTPKAAVSPPSTAPRQTEVARERRIVGQPSPAAEPSTDTSPPLPTAVAAPPPRHKEAAPRDKTRKVNLPRCSCMQTICDCVEEQ